MHHSLQIRPALLFNSAWLWLFIVSGGIYIKHIFENVGILLLAMCCVSVGKVIVSLFIRLICISVHYSLFVFRYICLLYCVKRFGFDLLIVLLMYFLTSGSRTV